MLHDLMCGFGVCTASVYVYTSVVSGFISLAIITDDRLFEGYFRMIQDFLEAGATDPAFVKGVYHC